MTARASAGTKLALGLLLAASFSVRAWYGAAEPSSSRFYDERFSFHNVTAFLVHDRWVPANAYYPRLSFLPQAGVLWASETLSELTGAVNVLMNLTYRHSTHEQLRSSEARYRAIFDNVQVSVFEVDFSEVLDVLDALEDDGLAVPGQLGPRRVEGAELSVRRAAGEYHQRLPIGTEHRRGDERPGDDEESATTRVHCMLLFPRSIADSPSSSSE